jgi:endonuclease/exonuclease/phosphatase family metal-dependent hydrolase
MSALAKPDADASGDGTASVALTVATFNIHHGVGARGRLDLRRTANAIAALGADVVSLQEVDRGWAGRSQFADQAEYLGERLRMHLAFGAARVRNRSKHPHGQYGNALLSRYAFRSSETTSLPRPSGGEPRALLETELVVDGVALRCLSTHLQHRFRTERLAQAEVVKSVAADGDGPAVLLGDLNARPRSREVRSLTEHLVDAWREHGAGRGHTFRVGMPFARIDYILTTPDIGVARVGVGRTDASDHLPVSASLRLW